MAVPICRVTDVKLHSLHIRKSYANPITKTEPNPNPNTNPKPNPNNTKPY